MTKIMKDKLLAILDRLSNRQADLCNKQLMAGFDGFIDSIQKVVFNHTDNQGSGYFQTIEDFGRYITAKKSGGFSLETQEIIKKFGGNVPITANTMARFGVSAHCIGAFGYPVIDPVFSGMQQNTSLYSYANPGVTSALEFNDGKIMLAQMTGLNNADWEIVKKCVGLEKIIKIVENSDLLCLLNWSEVKHINGMWEGLLQEVFPVMTRKKKAKTFFDLADCSMHNMEQIRHALELISQFTSFCDVTLSLNRNEAYLLSKALGSTSCDDPGKSGALIFHFLNINTLIVHTSARSFAWKGSHIYQADTVLVDKPMISTGAGDNFNAGFCIGELVDLETEQSLMLANLLAACYMKNGSSPDLNSIYSFVNEMPVLN